MLFNSIDFAIFLPIVFFCFWFIAAKSIRVQNAFIVIASYWFYGWWDWRFLSLIAFSTLVDFSVGLYLYRETNQLRRKLLLWASVLINLGLLGFFKYHNFFIENFVRSFSFFGIDIGLQSVSIVLPVGISFYTFQTLSYTIDIYKGKLKPTKDLIAFAAFVSFFPQLVAGPIERATHLLPQFFHRRVFNYAKAVDGMRQILWGLVKKIIIADNCGVFVDQFFGNHETLNGSTLLIGAVLFSFQIYGDFSGYSDIAIGTSRLFGFDLKRNFAFPYFSRDIAEFWRRWHISLSTWFRDYLYIPLGGSKGSTRAVVRNTLIIFVVSGFWHGANWTFVIWGVINAIYFLPLLLSNNNRKHLDTVATGRKYPKPKELALMVFTFSQTTLAWVFFRAENLPHALDYISRIFSRTLFQLPYIIEEGGNDLLQLKQVLLNLSIFLLLEWRGRNDAYAFQTIGSRWPKALRMALYSFIILLIFYFTPEVNQQFIYFQF